MIAGFACLRFACACSFSSIKEWRGWVLLPTSIKGCTLSDRGCSSCGVTKKKKRHKIRMYSSVLTHQTDNVRGHNSHTLYSRQKYEKRLGISMNTKWCSISVQNGTYYIPYKLPNTWYLLLIRARINKQLFQLELEKKRGIWFDFIRISWKLWLWGLSRMTYVTAKFE